MATEIYKWIIPLMCAFPPQDMYRVPYQSENSLQNLAHVREYSLLNSALFVFCSRLRLVVVSIVCMSFWMITFAKNDSMSKRIRPECSLTQELNENLCV